MLTLDRFWNCLHISLSLSHTLSPSLSKSPDSPEELGRPVSQKIEGLTSCLCSVFTLSDAVFIQSSKPKRNFKNCSVNFPGPPPGWGSSVCSSWANHVQSMFRLSGRDALE